MQKAKEQAALYSESYKEVEELTDDDRTSLKLEINNLLHTYLPANITVGDVEALAHVIFNMVTEPNEFLQPKKD